jgi:hypothetical protein
MSAKASTMACASWIGSAISRVRKPLFISFQKAHPHPLEDAMLHKISNGWLQDKAQVTALLLTLLFFTSLYLGFT